MVTSVYLLAQCMRCCTSLQLRGVNEALNEYVSTVSGASSTGSLYHTLQRHNEILQDYNKEFLRTKVNKSIFMPRFGCA